VVSGRSEKLIPGNPASSTAAIEKTTTAEKPVIELSLHWHYPDAYVCSLGINCTQSLLAMPTGEKSRGEA